MVLTKGSRKATRERAQADSAFRRELLLEGLALCHAGDFARGRGILRDYINATIGFPRLSEATRIPSPSLQRMFGPHGNPCAQNIFGIIAALHKAEGVDLRLQMHHRTSHSSSPSEDFETGNGSSRR